MIRCSVGDRRMHAPQTERPEAQIGKKQATVLPRAMLGLVVLLLVLGLLLFVAAGMLRYWRGWLYLAVFGGAPWR